MNTKNKKTKGIKTAGVKKTERVGVNSATSVADSRGGPPPAVPVKNFFRAQEPKAPVTYCDHALSGVRPSSVRRPSVR